MNKYSKETEELILKKQNEAVISIIGSNPKPKKMFKKDDLAIYKDEVVLIRWAKEDGFYGVEYGVTFLESECQTIALAKDLKEREE